MTKTSFLLASTLFVAACAVDAGDPADDLATTSSELVLDGKLAAPPEGTRVVRVSSAALVDAANAFLGGQLITADTTGTSPIKYGPPYTVCEDVNVDARNAATDACYADFSGTALSTCLAHAMADFPVQTECHTSAQAFHSYIDFNAIAEASSARDVLFTVSPIKKSIGFIDYRYDINYLRSAPATITGGISNATLSFWLPFTSNGPTLKCSGSWTCMDIAMTNMRLLARFTSLRPGPDYTCAHGGVAPSCTAGPQDLVSAQLGFDTQRPTFYFSRNIVGVPDAIVTLLVDVDAVIRGAVEGKTYDALTSAGGKAAVGAFLTGVAINRVKQTTHPTIKGFSHIANTWIDGDQLVIEYDWY